MKNMTFTHHKRLSCRLCLFSLIALVYVHNAIAFQPTQVTRIQSKLPFTVTTSIKKHSQHTLLSPSYQTPYILASSITSDVYRDSINREPDSRATSRSQKSSQSLQKDTRSKTPRASHIVSGALSGLKSAVKASWWRIPLALCFIPLVCQYGLQTTARTPDWWKMIDLTHLRKSPRAGLVIFSFLFSNIAYFTSGAYLIKKFPLRRLNSTKTGANTPALNKRIPYLTSRYTWLGIWLLTAGLVSTVFHAVQVLGDPVLAESLCFVDHGIAISSGAYFMEVCGFPSKRVLCVGLIGLATLACTYQPTYAAMHGVWHFISALTSVMWALQAGEKRAKRHAQLEIALKVGKLQREAKQKHEKSQPQQTTMQLHKHTQETAQDQSQESSQHEESEHHHSKRMRA